MNGRPLDLAATSRQPSDGSAVRARRGPGRASRIAGLGRVVPLVGVTVMSVMTVVGVLVANPVQAQQQARIYRCEPAAGGPPVFQNTPGRNCKELDLPPLTTVPAPRLPAAANRSSPGAGASSAPTASAGRTDGFPRVGATEQRQRDSDRRRILEDELKREESRLTQIRKEYNGGEPERQGDERNYQKYLDRVERLKQDLQRSEGNVASLQRELDSVR